ncbi:N-acetylneuraminate synthase [Thermaerobacter sp. PB12/4term]|uniref:N-acetylneuraminate synthase family protein n=1 Tax=Thermaerobacter sp. PB12/4term TaxID=2293838 RepID=UPI000E32AE9F|nr:N-acetylneuraminate synthase family protein [Thermaerobacter sp. PB12/4term]QIA26698.1 N-acetylneuraminate synthase [Thermaerobacter sp. PB12/4term]
MQLAVRIGDRVVGEEERVYVIAEIGVNHNGREELAKELIDAAVNAGADAVKFQTFDPDTLVVENARAPSYQRNRTGRTSQRDVIRGLSLGRDAFERLAAYARAKGVDFLSTPFDIESIGFLVKIGVPAIKISSGDLTFRPLVEAAARTGLPVILSTGMATLGEIEAALDGLSTCDVILLHCVSSYPAPVQDANLRAIETLRRAFGRVVGYSDHTTSVAVPAMAVMAGAAVIEKHLTLDRSLVGPDHAASLEPDEFAAMVRYIREAEVARGTGYKTIAPSEKELRLLGRRGAVAARDLSAGSVLGATDISFKRPARGISPMEAERFLVGRRLVHDLRKDDPITLDDVAPNVEPDRGHAW